MYGDTVPDREISIREYTVWGQTAKFNDRQYFRLYGIVTRVVRNVCCVIRNQVYYAHVYVRATHT